MAPIQGIQAYQQVAGVTPTTTPSVVGSGAPVGPDFATRLTNALENVEAQHATADGALAKLASGEEVDLHGTMIELEKADIALRTMVSVRDRFISAYEQVMNMTV